MNVLIGSLIETIQTITHRIYVDCLLAFTFIVVMKTRWPWFHYIDHKIGWDVEKIGRISSV